MLYFKKVFNCLIVICIIQSGCLQAQSEFPVKDSMRKIILNEIVISAFRIPQSMDSTAKSISVIDRNQLEKAIYNNVGELLSTLPGIYVTGSNLNPGSSQTIFIRGNNSNHSVVMMDGIRISDPSSVDNGIDISEISVNDADHIEVVRGPQSAMYGSSALGGLINIISSDNSNSRFYCGIDSKSSLFNKNATSFINNVKIGGHFKNGIYLNSGIYLADVNGFNATLDTIAQPVGYHNPDKDNFRKQDFFIKTGYKNKGLEVYFLYKKTFQHIELDKSAFKDDDNRFLTFNRNLFSYGIKYKIKKQLNVEFSGGFSDSKRIDTDDSSIVLVKNNSFLYDHQYAKTTFTGSYMVNDLLFNYHADKFRLLFGLNSTEEKMNNINYIYSNMPPWGVYEYKTDLDSLNLHATVKSVFLQSGISGKLISDRLSGFWLDFGARFSNHNKFGNNFTYEICPSYKSGKTMLYFSFASGYNAPSLYRLYTPDKSYGAITTRGNSRLKPETSNTFEAGLKYLAGEQLRFTLAYYNTTVKNLIEYVYLWNKNVPIDSLGNDYMRNDNFGDTYINLSEQKINGLELGMNMRLSPKLNLVANFSLINGYTIYSSKDIDTSQTGGNYIQLFESGLFLGNKEVQVTGLTRRPASMAYIGLVIYPVKKMTINFENRFTGTRNDAYFNSAIRPWGAMDRMVLQGYVLTDLTLAWDFSKNFSMAVKAENIFDTDYVEINGYATRKRGFYIRLKYNFER